MSKELVCIECILHESHKGHEMIAIDKAAEREKAELGIKEKMIVEMSRSIEKAEERTHRHLNEIEQRNMRNEE